MMTLHPVKIGHLINEESNAHLNSGLLYQRVHFPTGLVFWNSDPSFEAVEWLSASVHET